MRRWLLLLLGIAPFFAALALQLVVLSILEVVFLVIWGIPVLPPGVNYSFSVIAVIVCGLVFFYWYQQLTHLRRRDNFKTIMMPGNLLLLVSMGVSSQLMISGILSILKPILRSLFEGYTVVMDKIFSGDMTVVVLYIALFAPIVEELIFRGVMLNKLLFALPFFAANIVQAAIFGIYHWNIIQGLYAFGIGLLLGYVSYRYRSLAASILLHMAINGSAFLVVYIPETKTAIILSTVIGIFLTVGLLWMITRRTSEQQSNPSNA